MAGRSKSPSLAVRLGTLAAGGSFVALVVAGLVMAALQRSGAERAFDEQLAVFLTQLFADYANQDVFDATAHFANPAFGLPGSGWYWVVADPITGEPFFASASLFDPLPAPSADQNAAAGLVSQSLTIGGQKLRLVEQIYQFEEQSVLVRVSAPTQLVDQEVRNFRLALVATLGAMWLALLVLSYFQVRIGLRPLETLQSAVQDVRASKTQDVRGVFPTEVSPLVQELNGLLAANDAIVQRARHHVGNLAHALKTPLAVILNSARAPAQPDTLQRIEQEAGAIEDRIRLYLDRAQRAATQGTTGKAVPLLDTVIPLVRTMIKLNQDKDLAFPVSIDGDLRVRADREDLEEILGNLLENACRHAKARINICAEQQDTLPQTVMITIDDDGPGLQDNERAIALQRGQRLDETSKGSGLGLSIVKEMVELYGGNFVISQSPLGGLRGAVTLPSAAPVPPES